MNRKCAACGATKPIEAFPVDPSQTGGHKYRCKACQAADMREARRQTPAEDKAEAQRAYRAGMRADKCAVCRAEIQGRGLCKPCQDAVEQLGGLEGLKVAARAVKYLAE
jgi:hypothetical protein